MIAPSAEKIDAIARAEYKLRQSELALTYLRKVPSKIAMDLRQGRATNHPDLRLDTFFFSCLSLAKSAYYIVKDDQAGHYRDAIHSWRMNVLDLKGRTQFNRMMKLRDIDVHQGRSEGSTLATMIPVEHDHHNNNRRYHPQRIQRQSTYAALGIGPPVTEHENPDGRVVQSYEGLQGSMNLYVDVAGETCEASNACEMFIGQLRTLIDAAGAGELPPAGLFIAVEYGI